MDACILIVDDELEIQKILSRHFGEIGYNTLCASSVDDALLLLSKNSVQIVISDIMMPGKLGTEFLQILSESYPLIKAIMITGYVSLENALTCMRKGAETCIFKPLGDMKELDEAVEKVYHWHINWHQKLSELQNSKNEL